MSRVVLTDAKVRALRPGARRFDVQDALLPGLIVHVTPTGSKSFMLKRRFPGSAHPTRGTPAAPGAGGGVQRSLRDSDDRSLQRRVTSVGGAARAMALHHLSCCSVGSRGGRRSDVRCRRRPADA